MKKYLGLFGVTWRKREYRAFLAIMILLSLAISSTLPLITLYLVDHLHVALALAGLFFVFEAILGLGIGLAVGRRSDRWRSRIPAMRLAATWVGIGWVVFALSPFIWLSLSVGAVFLSATAVVMGQAFAALHDVMVRDEEQNPGLVNTAVRTGFSLGFAIGPLVGSQIASLASFRLAFLVAAGLNFLCLIPLWGLDVTISSGADDTSSVAERRSNRLLYIFVGLCTLVLMGTALRITYLPIDVTKHLGGSLRQYGTVMAVSPLAELVTLPVAGLLALRFRVGHLFAVGLVIASVEYLILSFNDAMWQVYLTQGMDALVAAVLFGLGLTYAQRLAPGRAGAASSLFGSAFGLATLIGNVVGGLSISALGIPHLFLIPLVTSCFALVAFIALDSRASGTEAAS